MNELEIRRWLNVEPDAWLYITTILAMAKLPYPVTDADQVITFATYLGSLSRSINATRTITDR